MDTSDAINLHSIKTCTNEAGAIQEVQLIREISTYKEAEHDTMDNLETIDLMPYVCETIHLDGSIDRITTTFDSSGMLSSIAYTSVDESLARQYGAPSLEKQEWEFTEEEPLVGISVQLSD